MIRSHAARLLGRAADARSLFALLLVASSACNGAFDAPNQNFGTLQDLTGRVAILTATQGLLVPTRTSFAFNAQTLGILGREGYNLDVSNPQAIPNFYTVLGDLAAGVWNNTYRVFKQANLVISAANAAGDLTDREKEAVRGFAQTVKALNLLYVIRGTDSSGAALDVAADPSAAPPPIVDRGQVYARIVQLLDSAQTHLQSSDSAFPFKLGPGFQGFDTRATFLQFNRALRAKVDVETGQYAVALTDLAASFVDTTLSLSRGVYHTFSTNGGDILNTLYDPTARQRYAHGSYATDAQLQAGGARDNRFLTKIRMIDSVARYGFTVTWTFQRYNSNVDPVPIIRNEELILLRAEANIGLGNSAAAIADINVVRTKAGLLPPISSPYVPVGNQPTTLLDELLYEKRYSLMWENGDRWVDLRHYGKLATLPKDRPGDLIFPRLQVPVNECVPRTPQPAGCQAVAGF
jgi:starch-binding outer membrane protein, SusD/RagB family